MTIRQQPAPSSGSDTWETHHHFNATSTGETFLPCNYLQETTDGTDYFQTMAKRRAVRLVGLTLRKVGLMTAQNVDCKVYEYANLGGTADDSDTKSCSGNTNVDFDVSVDFAAGESCHISFDPATSALGECSVTCEWQFIG